MCEFNDQHVPRKFQLHEASRLSWLIAPYVFTIYGGAQFTSKNYGNMTLENPPKWFSNVILVLKGGNPENPECLAQTETILRNLSSKGPKFVSTHPIFSSSKGETLSKA